MPTYEYICKNCGENFEVFQSFSDKPLKKHKVCGGELKKVFHARGIVFKGSGFYATDAKGSPSSTGNGTDKSDSKSDSKPDARPEPKPKANNKGKSETKTAAAASD